MHTFDSLCRYPKRKNVSLSNPLTRIRRTRLSQGVGPRNPLAKNRILRSVNRIAARGERERGRCALGDASSLLRHLALLGRRLEAGAERAWRAHAVLGQIAPRVAARGRRAGLPAGSLLGGLERGEQAHGAQPLPCMRQRAVAHRVDPADLERVEPELLGADVEVALGRELALQR